MSNIAQENVAPAPDPVAALRRIAAEAKAARAALCAHELQAILENIERLCAAALADPPAGR